MPCSKGGKKSGTGPKRLWFYAGALILGALFVALLVSEALATGYTFRNAGRSHTIVQTGTYADSQTDTYVIEREPNLSAVGIGFEWADSVSITSILVTRAPNSVYAPMVQSTDTLATSLALTAAGARNYTISMTPMSKFIKVTVVYAGSANGVTSATNKAILQKQFGY